MFVIICYCCVSHTTVDQTSSIIFSEFIRNVFAKSPSDVALFVHRGLTNESITTNNQHLSLPFSGGPDDRLALTFLIQLCGKLDQRPSNDHQRVVMTRWWVSLLFPPPLRLPPTTSPPLRLPPTTSPPLRLPPTTSPTPNEL
jgi:hypothetical protein